MARAAARPARRLVVETGKRTRLGTIRRAGDGRDVTIVHHGRAVPPSMGPVARRGLVGEARVGLAWRRMHRRMPRARPCGTSRFRLGDEVGDAPKSMQPGVAARRAASPRRRPRGTEPAGRRTRSARRRSAPPGSADRLDSARGHTSFSRAASRWATRASAALAAPRQVLHVVVVARAAAASNRATA